MNPSCPACFHRNVRQQSNGTWKCKYNECSKVFTHVEEQKPEPKKGSGVVAGPPFLTLRCREILKANAEARAAVDGKRKGSYFGKGR